MLFVSAHSKPPPAVQPTDVFDLAGKTNHISNASDLDCNKRRRNQVPEICAYVRLAIGEPAGSKHQELISPHLHAQTTAHRSEPLQILVRCHSKRTTRCRVGVSLHVRILDVRFDAGNRTISKLKIEPSCARHPDPLAPLDSAYDVTGLTENASMKARLRKPWPQKDRLRIVWSRSLDPWPTLTPTWKPVQLYEAKVGRLFALAPVVPARAATPTNALTTRFTSIRPHIVDRVLTELDL